jgi:phosphoserine phosphatase
MNDLPLCVDLDGTLITGDTTRMSFFRLLRTSPLRALMILPLFWTDRARFKSSIAEYVSIDPATLPYFPDVAAFLQAEHARGRKLILATASHVSIAKAVAEHLGFFDDVVATEGAHNYAGAKKGEELVRRYGEKGFDYAGNEHKDLKVWAHAHAALIVRPRAGLVEEAKKIVRVEKVFA